MPAYQKHIFICTHQRAPTTDGSEPRASCAAAHSEKIKDCFKEELKKRALNKQIRANASGCLDACAQGPSVVIYPEAVWYQVKTEEDVKEIVEEHCINNRIVKHLQIC